MKYSGFQTTLCHLCFLSLVFAACKKPVNPCIPLLQQRDSALIQRVDSLMLRRNEMTLVPYRTALEQLRAEEKQLFAEVDNCDFGKDLQAWNYWYRGRLKFPSKIEQELQRLERDSAGK